ncbi:MAG: hypothetical protein ACREOZ_03460, partial [Gloeomargaritales cyanobacterium]
MVANFNPYDRLDQMMDFSLFADRPRHSSNGSSANLIGSDIIVYMHHFLKDAPSLVPYFVRNLPDGVGKSEGDGQPSDKQAKIQRTAKSRAMRASTPTIDLTGIVAALAPSQEELESHKSFAQSNKASAVSHKIESLKKLADFRMSVIGGAYDDRPEKRAGMLDY